MPNYDYKCQQCENKAEMVVKYDDRDLLQLCEECGTINLKRTMSMPRVLKASYPDGYKRAGWSDLVADARLKEAKSKLDWKSDDAKTINKELDERENKAKK